MKKLFLFIIILVVDIFLFAHTVDAHELATDRSIGAVLHIEPNDDPIAGQQSVFIFAFKDTQNKFKPDKCECTFSVSETGKEIYSQPLFQNNQNPSLNNASMLYTFPKRDVYQVKVIGKPTAPNAFQPFTLSYDIRVDRIATQPVAQNNNFFVAHLIYFVGIFGIVLTFVTIAMVKKSRQTRS